MNISKDDLDIAFLYAETEGDRAKLGLKLFREGLGTNHYTFSGCPDRHTYINLILDQILGEDD